MKTFNWHIQKLILFLLLLFCFTQVTRAQLFKKLKEVVKQTASQTVQDRASTAAGNATNKAIDSSTSKFKGLFKKHDKRQKTASIPDGTPPADGTATSTANGSMQAPASISSYQNYDFVPGDTILFMDDFTQDQDGEFPSHWNLTKGQAVVNNVAGRPSFLLTDGNYCHVLPRMEKTAYLTDPFTIEFDTYNDGNGNESPILFLTYVDKDGNNEDGEIEFDRGDDNGRGGITLSNFPNDLSADLPTELRSNYMNSWHHCAIIYKNNQLKCYVDQYRVLTVPNLGCVPVCFGFEGIGDQHSPIVLANIRAAAGGNMNMVGKKFTAAKIVTHGITFDIDKADLKPESMGTLNMIAHVLNSNPDLKFEIDGHTDNTGETAHNLTLSEQRAAAVKAQLMAMGISDQRLTTKGFGDTQPISSNDTQEGRANNRRVEFIRM